MIEMDVEDLLVWAYRDQAVEHMAGRMRAAAGRSGPRAHGAGPLAGLIGLGTRVDAGSGALAALGADAADDALLAHDAVLRLPRMLLDWRPGGEGAFALHWADELAAAGIAEHTDRSLWASDGRALAAVWLEPAVLITLHARAGSRPDVWIDWVEGAGGRSRDTKGRWIADRDAYRLTHDDVAAARAEYACWRAGLVRLVHVLAPALGDYRLTGPRVEGAPWLGAKAAESRPGQVERKALKYNDNMSQLTSPVC